MIELSVFLLFVLVTFALMCVVVAFRPMPLSAAIAAAYVSVIGVESILVNCLSIFQAVTRENVLIVHLLLLFGWGVWAVSSRNGKIIFSTGSRFFVISRRYVTQPPFFFLSPFLVILALTALTNAPNTWDSLTYHMARVAHWINAGTVDYYFTSIDRQNEMSPGAEYFILFFQILTNSDILASMPQFISFLLLPGPTYYFLRIFKLPRGYIPYIILLTVSTPMAVSQAFTTQNDLICGLATLAILVSSARLFAGNYSKFRLLDYALVGTSIGVGLLIKPIAVLVSAPFLVIGVIIQAASFKISKSSCRKIFYGSIISILVILMISGPDIYRKVSHSVIRGEVYPLYNEWNKERLLNPLSTTVSNIPWPEEYAQFLRTLGVKSELFARQVFNIDNSDYVGNPIQLMLIILFFLLSVILLPFTVWRKENKGRLFLLSVCPLLAWISFSLIVRNQPWITRLQLPIFLLLPFSVLYILSLPARDYKFLKLLHAGMVCATIFSVSYSSIAATRNKARHISLKTFWGSEKRRISYDFDRHNAFMKEAENQNCKRIGLFLGGDSPDYPLTWRARDKGMITRHMDRMSIGGWPCMMYVEMEDEQKILAQDYNWIQFDKHTWSRDLEYEFNNASSCYDFSDPDRLLELRPFPPHNLSLVKNVKGVLISARDNDPALLLPRTDNCTYNNSAILEIIIESPYNTDVQLFYKLNKSQEYLEENSISKRVQVGKNIVYFLLPMNEIHGDLRLDIGRKEGEYLLSAVRLKAIAN